MAKEDMTKAGDEVRGVTAIAENGTKIFLPCVPGQTSDGYHTFDELYMHRNMLFVSLIRMRPSHSWRSLKNYDGSSLEGWFIAGMGRNDDVLEPVSYHLPLNLWNLLNGIPTLKLAPEWDGHTSQDVVKRLRDWLAFAWIDGKLRFQDLSEVPEM